MPISQESKKALRAEIQNINRKIDEIGQVLDKVTEKLNAIQSQVDFYKAKILELKNQKQQIAADIDA